MHLVTDSTITMCDPHREHLQSVTKPPLNAIYAIALLLILLA